MDAGKGFNPKFASFTAGLVLVLAVALAVAIWLLAGLVPGVDPLNMTGARVMSKPESIRTPLGKVRGLGSAKHGAGHFIAQRVSAIALIFLVPWFLISLIGAVRGGYDGALA